MIPLAPPKLPENRAKRKIQNHSDKRTILGFSMPPMGVEPVLCLQKGILSPSCLPAFGKVDFCSLYHSFSHFERDFSFASERDSHFFDKMIVSHFLPHVNHVKLFHLVVLDLRSVRGPGLPPGRSPCPDALLRVGVMRCIRGWWGIDGIGLDDGLSLIFEEYFWNDWNCFDVLTALMHSHLWCSLRFICSFFTLPVLFFC